MLKLLDNNELRYFSIFIVWLVNISGFFGILSDQKDFFLSSSPYVLTMTLFLLVVNNSIDKKYLTKLFFIFLLGLSVEIIGVNFSFFFGEYKYGDNLGVKIFDVPVVIGFNWVLLIILTGNFANRVFQKSIIGKVLFGSIMMILLDLLIEISAPKLDYWEFALNPVPLSNYFWWLIFSILFHLIYQSNNNKEFLVSSNILVIHFLFFGLLAFFL
ncbi:MAG: carotenoid biosynthesis protein [Flavobacteriaceae bacterium]|nr:carotenoid biosynthesis protein [Flavobacteriaceae bacterium]MBL6678442.1 carotenoid biosynthesis protein [Flavobacteriaceae bacterium]